MADAVAIRVLGPVRLVTGEGTELSFRGHAARLLAWLALRPGRTWSADDLAERLWPAGAPPTARTAIQGHVSRLRRTLRDVPGVMIDSTPGGYVLRAEPEAVDAGRFASLCAAAADEHAAGRAAAAADLLAAALALWTGEALADLHADRRLAAEAAALDDQRRGAEEQYAHALIDTGDGDRALAVIGRLVNDDPLRERRWALLMTALAGAGRQADALRAYRQAVAVLRDRTGLDPGPELQRLETAILVQDPALDAARWQPAPTSAPAPLTTLVGRDTEQAAVTARLAQTRLVTLVGPGGVGKTTLAVAVGAAEAGTFPDGVVVVDLGAGGPDDVAAALASAVGVTRAIAADDPAAGPLDRVAVALARRQVLVVLDNCEHVAAEAARVAVTLLRAAPGVRVLATSQVALGAAGEAVVVLAPLAVPGPGAGAAEVQASPAGALFARRLDDVGCRPADDRDWADAGAIVRALDGLPLAIEIAAAAARLEPLGPLADRLARDATVVLDAEPPVGAGRRRLRLALDAAVGRLDAATAAAYAHLAVFPAGFEADAAAAVTGLGEDAARAALGRLADASLVVYDGPRRRGRLLQPVRAHAAARLDPDDRTAAEDRLAAWAQQLADELDRRVHSPAQPEVIERFVAELPVFRLTLRHLLDQGAVAGAARLYASLVVCWGDSPAGPEAPRWGEELMEHAGALDPGPRARLELAAVKAQYAFDLIAARLELAQAAYERAHAAGEVLVAAAAAIQLAIALGWRGIELDRVDDLLAEARETFLARDEASGAAAALEYQGLAKLRSLDLPGGIRVLEEAAAEHRANGGPSDVAHALMFIGYARRVIDDQTGALRAFEEARRLLGGTRVVTWLRATIGAGHAALALGDTAAAQVAFRAAHERAADVGDRRVTGTALVGLAVIAREGGDAERCVSLLDLAASEALAGGDPADAGSAAGMLAELLFERDHVDEAAVLVGAADAVEDQATVRVDFGLAYDDRPLRQALTERLGAERLADLAGDGTAIGVAACVRRATELLLDGRDGPDGDNGRPALRVVGGGRALAPRAAGSVAANAEPARHRH